ncbi:MAG: NifU family protein [Chloroflexia bacterium]
MSLLQEKEFQQRIQRIEGLVQDIETIPDPTARAGAEELVQAILDLHGAGLERILELISNAGEPGNYLMGEFAGDGLVSSLLLLHGLHPLDLETRVTQALDKVRPYLASHGGNVELVGVEEGVVRLRLQGSCNGCPSSAMTLKLAIEEALQEFAPDIAELKVEGVVERPQPAPIGFVPISQMKAGRQPAGAGRWEMVGDLADLSRDTARSLDVAGTRLCFCRVDTEFYAYGNVCPGCNKPMESPRLSGTALTCPNCRLSYDVMRAGRCVEQPRFHLEPFPLLVEQGRVKVALPAALSKAAL